MAGKAFALGVVAVLASSTIASARPNVVVLDPDNCIAFQIDRGAHGLTSAVGIGTCNEGQLGLGSIGLIKIGHHEYIRALLLGVSNGSRKQTLYRIQWPLKTGNSWVGYYTLDGHIVLESGEGTYSVLATRPATSSSQSGG